MASKIARQIAAILAGSDLTTIGRAHETAAFIDSVLEGKTIKKSEVEHLKRVEKDYYSSFDLSKQFVARDTLDTVVKNRDYWCDLAWEWEEKAILASVRTNEFRNKLWAAEQEIHDLKYELERRNREHEFVERAQDSVVESLQAQRDRQAETIAKQDATIDDFIEENLDLHFELNLAREIPKMAATVVQFADETELPEGHWQSNTVVYSKAAPITGLNWTWHGDVNT